MKTIQSICLTALVATFLANPAALPAADAAAGKSEAAGKVKPYPLKTCVVSGEEIDEKGAMKPYSFVYQGQEIKLCCESCKKDFDKDPKKYLKKIAEAAKVKPYPLKTCVVSGEEINDKGSMKPYSFVYQGQEVKLCCESCKKDFDKNPKKYLGMIEKAAKEAEKKKSKKS